MPKQIDSVFGRLRASAGANEGFDYHKHQIQRIIWFWVGLGIIIFGIIIGLFLIAFWESRKIETVEFSKIVFTEVKAQEPILPVGIASYYDYVLDSGWSSRGHRVCAVRDWPRKTMLKVTNIETGQSTICKVTDYGPNKEMHPDRIIDLSSTAFADLSPLRAGLVNVSIEVLSN